MKLTASYIKKLIKEEYNFILLEGRVEDLKTRYPPERVDTLANLEINKTTNNKYLEWMLEQGEDADIAELENAVSLFNKNANRLSDKGLPASIGAYKSIEDIKAKISSLGLTKGERDVAAREQTIFHDIGEPLMCFLTPTTTLASQKYGKSTTWCIAAREESDNMFTVYTEDKDSVFYFLYRKDYKPPVGLKKSSDFQTIQQYRDYIEQMKASGVDTNKFAIQVMSEEAAYREEYITDEDLDKAYESDDKFYLLKKCTTVWNAINEEISLDSFKKAVGQQLYNTTINFIFSKELQKATSVQKAKHFYENAIDNLRYLHVDHGAQSLKSAENFKYDVERLLELGNFVLYNKLLKIAEPQILPKYRKASGIDKMEILTEPEQRYSHLRENKMKLTKSYIKQVIMEELGRLKEVVQSPALDVARKKIAQSQYDNLSDSEALTAASRDSEIRNAIAQNKNLSPEEIATLEKERGFDKNNPLAVKMANSSKIKTPATPGSEEEKFRQSLRLTTK